MSFFSRAQATQQPATVPTLGASILGSQAPAQTGTQSILQMNQEQPQQQQVQAQDGAHQAPASSQSAFFDSLLERSRRRPNDENGVNGLGQIPSLQLGLSDIGRRVRELGGAQGVTQGGQKTDSRA